MASETSAEATCLASPFWEARVTIAATTTVDYSTVTPAELIRACAGKGEAAAWQEFIRRFDRLIATTAYRVARRWGESSPAVVDDLIQETYLKLCADRGRVLREFESPNPDAVFAFLKVVTSNVANDYFKRLRAGKRGGHHASDTLEHAEHSGSAAACDATEGLERRLLLDEVDACLRAKAPSETNERDRVIFWLYYRQGLTAKEIGNMPSIGLTMKGVESTLHRLTQLVRTHLVETRRRKLGAPEKAHGKGL